MNNLQRIWAFREGGQTKRCHTMNYHGHYDVAQHSFNMLSMLFLLHTTTPPSQELIKAVLWHDIPERWTGDVPTTAKMADPELKRAMSRIEQEVLIKLGIRELFPILTREERNWLDALDLLELALWATEQEVMGNKTIVNMKEQIRNIFLDRLDIIPEEIQEVLHAKMPYYRSPECNELLEENDKNESRSS